MFDELLSHGEAIFVRCVVVDFLPPFFFNLSRTLFITTSTCCLRLSPLSFNSSFDSFVKGEINISGTSQYFEQSQVNKN